MNDREMMEILELPPLSKMVASARDQARKALQFLMLAAPEDWHDHLMQVVASENNLDVEQLELLTIALEKMSDLAAERNEEFDNDEDEAEEEPEDEDEDEENGDKERK